MGVPFTVTDCWSAVDADFVQLLEKVKVLAEAEIAPAANQVALADEAPVAAVRHLARNLERIADGELALAIEALPQRLPLDVRHDIVDQSVHLVGIVQRQDVRVVQATPFGDPLVVLLRGTRLALRRQEASWITVV